MDLSMFGLTGREMTTLNSAHVSDPFYLIIHTNDFFSKSRAGIIRKTIRAWIITSFVTDVDTDDNDVIVSFNRDVNEGMKYAIWDLMYESNIEIVIHDGRTIVVSYEDKELAEKNKYLLLSLLSARGNSEEPDVTDISNELRDLIEKKGFDGWVGDVFDSIHGNEMMKKAVGITMFSTDMNPVHSLIIGPPACGKTIARDILLKFPGILHSGANLTRAGMVINMATGAYGVMANANKSLLWADEFNRVDKNEIDHVLELMSSGTAAIHSGSVHEDIQSHFRMVGTANPRNDTFSGNIDTDIEFPPVLMSRFALVVKALPLSRNERLSLFESKLRGEFDISSNIGLYEKWVAMARSYNPKFECSDIAVKRLVGYAVDMVEHYSSAPIRRDERVGDYIRGIAESRARSEIRSITDDDLDWTIKLYVEMIDGWYRGLK